MPIPPFFFCVLDTEGTGGASPPDYYTCHDFKLVNAKGKTTFIIELEGWCGVHPGGGLPGWTPVDRKLVTVYARYFYNSKVCEETIRYQGNDLLKEYMECESNPWAHTPDCTLTSELVNNTNSKVNGPFPFSANRIPYSLREAIAKYEKDYQSPEEILSEWDPYGSDSSSSPDMEFQSPGQYEIIPENSTSFTLAVVLKTGATVPQNLELQWQQIILAPEWVGDIKLPEGSKYWWKPFFGPPLVQWANVPLQLAVTSGYFANKPGLYEVRVRNAEMGVWSKAVRFWIGEPTFEPPPLLQLRDRFKLQKKVAKKQLKLKKKTPKAIAVASPQKLKVQSQAQLTVTKVEWSKDAKPGENIDLQVTVTNKGTTMSKAGFHRVFTSCLPIEECGQTSSIVISKAINAGQSHTFTFKDAVKPKQGNTRFFVSTQPMNIGRFMK